MEITRYSRLTVDGDKQTRWKCGCYTTIDDFFKFCPKHNESLKKAILSQIDELDMTLIVEEKSN